MKLFAFGASFLALAALAAISFAPPAALHRQQAAASSATTCTTKHCSPNTHCCYSCTGSPICVNDGVPCPECAPQ